MTLVSSIIQKAYRANNLIPLGVNPNTDQLNEGLYLLNNIILSSVGNEASDGLYDLAVGGSYDQSEVLNPWVPDNSRLLLNLTAATTLTLDPYPQEGQRFAVSDVAGNLATYNVTIDGNGRNVEGAATLTLNLDDTVGQWLYRADTGNWVRIETLASTDEMPFPAEFDDYFIILLAIRINPSYGQAIAPETLQMFKRSRTQFHSRYAQDRQVLPDADWRSVTSQRNRYTALDDFNTGRL